MANFFKKIIGGKTSENQKKKNEDEIIKEIVEEITKEDDEKVKKATEKREAERTKKNSLDISFLTRNSHESKSEYATFINNNFSQTKNNINGRAFIEKIRAMLFSEKKNSLTLKIDNARSLIITLDNDTKKLSVDYKDNASGRIFSLFDKKTENYLALEQKLNKFYMEVNPESSVVKNYTFKKWDISYQGVTDIEQKRKIINNIYNELLDTGFFAEAQARTLAKAMLLDYDINCFANPLYTVGQMEQLILTYGDLKMAAEAKYPLNVEEPQLEENRKLIAEVMSKIENKYRDLNQFCSMNFKYKFCDSEFAKVKTAAERGKLTELSLDPNLPAKFKLLYSMDEAAINGVPKKINIGDSVFVVESYFVYSKDKNPIAVNSKVSREVEGVDGTVRLVPIYTETFGKKPIGSLEPFYSAYKAKYSITDSMELINMYKAEITNGIKDNTNDNNSMEVKLSNGDTLLIKGIKFYKGEIDSEYDVSESKADYGVQIYYKTKSKTELVYSDKPHDRMIYTNLSTLLRKCGGIISDDRFKSHVVDVDKTKGTAERSIADEILSSKPQQAQPEYLSPEEMYDKYYKMGLDNGSATVDLPNGDALRFKRNIFIKENKVHHYCMVQYKKGNSEFKNIYSITSNSKRQTVRGSKQDVLAIYKAAVYGGNLEQLLQKAEEQQKMQVKPASVIEKNTPGKDIR